MEGTELTWRLELGAGEPEPSDTVLSSSSDPRAYNLRVSSQVLDKRVTEPINDVKLA